MKVKKCTCMSFIPFEYIIFYLRMNRTSVDSMLHGFLKLIKYFLHFKNVLFHTVVVSSFNLSPTNCQNSYHFRDQAVCTWRSPRLVFGGGVTSVYLLESQSSVHTRLKPENNNNLEYTNHTQLF